jgi:prolyl 4-hydroxylase
MERALQILRYRKGQEYRPHFDSFPDGAGGAVHTARGGQRVNTVLVYLQSPEAGGGTAFPACGLTVCPQPGSAVIFRNVDGTGRRDPASLHAGLPVVHGEKVVMTYWQRARTLCLTGKQSIASGMPSTPSRHDPCWTQRRFERRV